MSSHLSDSDSDDEQLHAASAAHPAPFAPTSIYSRFDSIESPLHPPLHAADSGSSSPSATGKHSRNSLHRCCLFRTEELVFQKRWEGADGCEIILQPFSKHAHSAETAVEQFKRGLGECGLHSTVASPAPQRLVVSKAAIVVVQDPRPMYALLPWCFLCLPAKAPPKENRFDVVPANATLLEGTLAAEVQMLIADQKAVLESMQRARARAQAHQDALDTAPTEAALRALNDARVVLEAQLARVREAGAAGRRTVSLLQVETCTLCHRVLVVEERASVVDAAALGARIETLRAAIGKLSGAAAASKRKKQQRKLKKLEEDLAALTLGGAGGDVKEDK